MRISALIIAIELAPSRANYMTQEVLIFSTAANAAEAQRIARELVERRLAACVNIIPQIHSVYRWAGKLEAAEECLLLIKTPAEGSRAVEMAIQELHSYELPECFAIRIDSGSAKYLNWIKESVSFGDRE
jgi:periplasmic divalent cation tolerance protein